MTTAYFHPATVQLLRLQSRGRRRRMWRRFCQPRRLALSAVALALAVVWLGNAAATIWLRETASPETLRALLSLGLVLYAGWHFTKAAFFRPESPFDWTPDEREILLALPLRPRDLVAYQLASVTVTTVLKSALFALLLWPDLRSVPLGLAGTVLAMMTLEVLRMAIEIATWGMGRRSYLAYRAAVLVGLVAAGVAVVAMIVREDVFAGQSDVGAGLIPRLLGMLIQFNDSVFGSAALPFQPFINLIVAEQMTPANAALTVAGLATVLVLAFAVIRLYATMSQRVAKQEKCHYGTNGANCERFAGATPNDQMPPRRADFLLRLWRIPHWGGAGALVWRQLLGARRHWGSVLTAMIAPAVLTCVPGFVIEDPYLAFLATTGTLVFYTFLLLPTAIRFDFRRDLDRLATLKGLPITPTGAVIGQTLAPVLIATLFQTGVMAVAITGRSLPSHFLLMAMLAMIPLNVLVFGLDNLIYLLYPHRAQQEGLEIFLRTMLTFTGKGLLFAVGLAAVSVWASASALLAGGISHWTGIAIHSRTLFMSGMVAGSSILAALVLNGLCRTYRNMNPIEDVPR